MSIIFQQIRSIISDVCIKAGVTELSDTIELEWDERRIGHTIDVDCLLNPTRAIFNISRHLFLNCRNEIQVVASATCHFISWVHWSSWDIWPGLATLYGHLDPSDALDWKALTQSYEAVVEKTCSLLDAHDLAEKISLEWNGRITRCAGKARWDSEAAEGMVLLAKKPWLLMIDDEQVEAVVHGVCLLADAARPELSEQLRNTDDRGGTVYPLLRRCGYRNPQSPMATFPRDQAAGGTICKPSRLRPQ